MSEDKKTRRRWLYDNETGIIITAETAFDLNKITGQAELFLSLYGCKQYLAHCIASKGGKEYSNEERAATMQERFSNLCSDEFKLTHTESGFHFKDPNAAETARQPSATLETIYNGLITDGKTPKEAAAKVLLWTGKEYTAKIK